MGDTTAVLNVSRACTQNKQGTRSGSNNHKTITWVNMVQIKYNWLLYEDQNQLVIWNSIILLFSSMQGQIFGPWRWKSMIIATKDLRYEKSMIMATKHLFSTNFWSCYIHKCSLVINDLNCVIIMVICENAQHANKWIPS